MKAALNKLIVEGTVFICNCKEAVLVQRLDAGNRIPFEKMENHGGFLTMFFCLRTRRQVDQLPSGDIEQTLIRKVTIPENLLKGEVAQGEDYADSFNRISYQQNWGVLLFSKEINQRLKGMLPRINVGESYIVDVKQEQLRLEKDLGAVIPFSKMFQDSFGSRHSFFLDTKHHQLVPYHSDLAQFSKHTVYVQLPSNFELDPIGSAQKRGLEATRFLAVFPTRCVAEIKIKPVTKDLLREVGMKFQKQISPEKIAGKKKGFKR